jgi:hypothetical protein
MTGTTLQNVAWKTIAAVVLTSIPLAERMLLYNVALIAVTLLPARPAKLTNL